MPTFMIKASYTAEGMKGLRADKASGREKAVAASCEALGGRVDAFYCALGEDDAIVIVDLPSHVEAAALGTTVGASGKATTCTVPLLTVEEADKALGRDAKYRPPGG